MCKRARRKTLNQQRYHRECNEGNYGRNRIIGTTFAIKRKTPDQTRPCRDQPICFRPLIYFYLRPQDTPLTEHLSIGDTIHALFCPNQVFGHFRPRSQITLKKLQNPALDRQTRAKCRRGRPAQACWAAATTACPSATAPSPAGSCAGNNTSRPCADKRRCNAPRNRRLLNTPPPNTTRSTS